MDALDGLLDAPRARGAFTLRACLDPPFGIDVRDEAPLTLLAVVRGGAWLVPDGERPVRLEVGDLALRAGPAPYQVLDRPTAVIRTVVLPGQRIATVDGEELCDELELGPGMWGKRPDAETMLLIGTYPTPGELGRSLLAVLPPLVVVRAGRTDQRLIALLHDETARSEPGQGVVLDRLLDLVLVSAVRTWLGQADHGAGAVPAWYLGRRDPVVARAMDLLHAEPSRPWTIAALAREVGVSRATLARRFTELVGEPPMAYLTAWRLALAADRLAEPGSTLSAVARSVGYGTPFALSAAFKRVRGMTPREHRRVLSATSRPTPR